VGESLSDFVDFFLQGVVVFTFAPTEPRQAICLRSITLVSTRWDNTHTVKLRVRPAGYAAQDMGAGDIDGTSWEEVPGFTFEFDRAANTGKGSGNTDTYCSAFQVSCMQVACGYHVEEEGEFA
jgi:hypothetical protein